MLSLENPLSIIVIFILLAMIPFALLGVTSFVKLSVVFGLLRNALGAQQVPSAAITTLLSLALSIHIMLPVFENISEDIEPIVKSELEKKNLDTLEFVLRIYEAGREPVLEFLRRFSSEEVRLFFAQSAQGASGDLVQPDCSQVDDQQKCAIAEESVLSLVPAFIVSELREAFTIGVLIFLPFLVVDLVVANILVGMGMMMVSPVTISMPLKIMLFVLCDGWFILSQNLILSYQ